MNRRISAAVADFLQVWGLLTLIVVVGFVITYQYVGAPPPRNVRMATGAKNGAYYAFAQEYARLLANDGIVLEVVPTAGSVENFELLKRDEVAVALVQGGSATNEEKQRFQSLGSLFLEPFWIFTRAQKPIKEFSQLKGRRVAVGVAGSGTYLLAIQLLSAAGITDSNTTFVRGDSAQAMASLSQGTIDAAIFVASPAAPLIRSILEQPDIQLVEFDRAPAYGRLFPFLTSVVLAEGVLNLERNVPARDITLVAVSANLVARRDLNPSLIPALLNAIGKAHEQGGVWYVAVREIDMTLQKNDKAVDAEALLKRLAELEREVASVSVPLSYTGELYNLRLHIGFLQDELERGAGRSSQQAS